MVIRIMFKIGGWYWIMETSRGDTVCISDNWRDMDGGYSRRRTAIKSAERFVVRYLGEGLQIRLVDEKSNILWEINSY